MTRPNADDYEPDFAEEDYDEEGVTCRRCKAEGLEWEQQGGRWALIEPDGENHVCTHMNATATDFDVLPMEEPDGS